MAANEVSDDFEEDLIENEVNDQLAQEVIAINAIYGEKTMWPMKTTKTSSPIFTVGHGETEKDEPKSVYIIHLSHQDIWLKIYFPTTYPDPDPSLEQKDESKKKSEKKRLERNTGRPLVLGTYKCGVAIRKGDAARICALFDEVLTRIYRPGEVCLFDVMEEMSLIETSAISAPSPPPSSFKNVRPSGSSKHEDFSEPNATSSSIMSTQPPQPQPRPHWSISEPLRELKSVFIARSALINVVADVYRYRESLLNEEKKVAAATHNIMAWRIRVPAKKNDSSTCDSTTMSCGIDRREEDYDDDGESAAGSRLLHLMQLMDVWNVIVIVSRWYGGTNLGPRRFTLINSVARDSLLKLTNPSTTVSTTSRS